MSNVHHPIQQELGVTDLRETVAQLTSAHRSDAKIQLNHIKTLPLTASIVIQGSRGKTAPTATSKDTLADSLEIKDFLITETDQESENNSSNVNLQNIGTKTTFFKSKDFRKTSNDWKSVGKDNFIIKKANKNRIQIRNLNRPKVQNAVPDNQTKNMQHTEIKNSTEKDTLKLRTKTKSFQLNTEGDLDPSGQTVSEYNLFKNAVPLDSFRITNISNQSQSTKNQGIITHKKVTKFLTGNQEDKPVVRNVVAPKLVATGSSVVKFNIVRKKDAMQAPSEQNISIRPFSLIENGEVDKIQKIEGSSKEGFYIAKVHQERPKSRFKTQEVILNRLFNTKNQ